MEISNSSLPNADLIIQSNLFDNFNSNDHIRSSNQSFLENNHHDNIYLNNLFTSNEVTVSELLFENDFEFNPNSKHLNQIQSIYLSQIDEGQESVLSNDQNDDEENKDDNDNDNDEDEDEDDEDENDSIDEVETEDDDNNSEEYNDEGDNDDDNIHDLDDDINDVKDDLDNTEFDHINNNNNNNRFEAAAETNNQQNNQECDVINNNSISNKDFLNLNHNNRKEFNMEFVYNKVISLQKHINEQRKIRTQLENLKSTHFDRGDDNNFLEMFYNLKNYTVQNHNKIIIKNDEKYSKIYKDNNTFSGLFGRDGAQSKLNKTDEYESVGCYCTNNVENRNEVFNIKNYHNFLQNDTEINKNLDKRLVS